LIRDNANYIIVFEQDHLNISGHINSDMNYEKCVKICQKCWEDKRGFYLIGKDNKMNNGR